MEHDIGIAGLLYSHRTLAEIEKGDIIISGIPQCSEPEDEECAYLRKRIDSLSKDDFNRILGNAIEIDELLNGTLIIT